MEPITGRHIGQHDVRYQRCYAAPVKLDETRLELAIANEENTKHSRELKEEKNPSQRGKWGPLASILL